MKIGLLRHFKVRHPYPRKFLVPHQDVVSWFDDYENAEIEKQQVDIGNWDICYTSPSPRALKTASHVFDGPIIEHDALKELQTLSLFNKRLALPFMVWAILVRNKNLSSNPISNEFVKNLNQFIGVVMNGGEQRVLICSHVFVLKYLQKELLARGFIGAPFKLPENGKIYIFEK
jgi:broad specificity phosphatase PhoE